MINIEECKNVKHKKCPCTITPGGGMAPCIAGSVPTSNDFVFFVCFILFHSSQSRFNKGSTRSKY